MVPIVGPSGPQLLALLAALARAFRLAQYRRIPSLTARLPAADVFRLFPLEDEWGTVPGWRRPRSSGYRR